MPLPNVLNGIANMLIRFSLHANDMDTNSLFVKLFRTAELNIIDVHVLR